MHSYTDRATYTTNTIAKRLFHLMDEKQTNLCVSADVLTKDELLTLADTIGPEICIFKTHIDIVEDFDNTVIIELQRLSEKHNFLLFEDRKFADIGNTVKHQYQHGIYHIADWADITNAHVLPGPGIIEGLRDVGMTKGRGLLLLAEMSSKGSLATGEYTKKTIELAETYKDFVIGFILQQKLSDNPGMIHMTPGVKMRDIGDPLGQQYNSPTYVIGEKGSDVIIVGRGIYEAENPVETAKAYRKAGWDAYLSR
ncbi:MAG: orotidine-5'-phosphate decarboxylase [Candidatus Magasanikbacteria bacterium CG10_big_fil_rev_8_21_14_0_10_42_10]|uniref:Orotidine 5'-phosphate decarboxylase n=2 Tax=Candidatus Magasanikiibacteriota TaxID=1752731 RepID=A0A2H0TWI8_9BACT|nr:MAG: orotidine-5'-phosphate decarboxylase [Candidatus Magasanikbacteria bacterium CG10_big_fil_rev_8_21_14_0_10_42_10]PIZ94481.1 MAG: orotidine-5'-phosphate decarboxylase [Candidatus Magasanikbacteria bacterium CG_4_10_14_0_2_um_filter_41_10]